MAEHAATPAGELNQNPTGTADNAVGGTDGTTESDDRTEHGADLEAAAGEAVEGESSTIASRSSVRLVVAFALVVLGLAGLVGWLGWQAYQSHHIAAQRALFVQVARQGAVNLTTIDFAHAENDVQRILDSATGLFYDDFSKRSQPFVEVVKQAQSKSQGTVTEAGLESETSTDAQVLVAVSVKTSSAGAAEQAPRAWRMRISVHKVGDQPKVSNVEFVP
jgi:Mce-associated membrane protein